MSNGSSASSIFSCNCRLCLKRFPCLNYSSVEGAVTPGDESKDNVWFNSHVERQEDQLQLLKDSRTF